MNPVSVRGWLFALAMLASPAVASRNAVTEWNQPTVSCALQAKQFPFVATRTLAIVHTAMFDAMNPVEGRYPPYKFKVAGPPGSSAEAAAAAAASLARVPDGNDQTSGAAVGEEVAGRILLLRGRRSEPACPAYRRQVQQAAVVGIDCE